MEPVVHSFLNGVGAGRMPARTVCRATIHSSDSTAR
jgi:hypothetical protein